MLEREFPRSINYQQVGILKSDDFLRNLPALRTRFTALLSSALPENFANFVTEMLAGKVSRRRPQSTQLHSRSLLIPS